MAEVIRQRAVLEAVLLQLLAEHPDGLGTSDAYDLIDAGWQFPEEWYREIPRTAHDYESLTRFCYSDCRDVPQEKIVELVRTEPHWQNELRWARNNLRKKGFSFQARRGYLATHVSGHAGSRQDLAYRTSARRTADRNTTTPAEDPGTWSRSTWERSRRIRTSRSHAAKAAGADIVDAPARS